MTDLPPGTTARLLVRVDSATEITLIDIDGQPVGQPRTVPAKVMASLQPVAIGVVVGDALQGPSGVTEVVRWVDETNPTRWSPSSNREPMRPSTEGYVHVGHMELD